MQDEWEGKLYTREGNCFAGEEEEEEKEKKEERRGEEEEEGRVGDRTDIKSTLEKNLEKI